MADILKRFQVTTTYLYVINLFYWSGTIISIIIPRREKKIILKINLIDPPINDKATIIDY